MARGAVRKASSLPALGSVQAVTRRCEYTSESLPEQKRYSWHEAVQRKFVCI